MVKKLAQDHIILTGRKGIRVQARQPQGPFFNLQGRLLLYYMFGHLKVFLSLLALIAYEDIFHWQSRLYRIIIKMLSQPTFGIT